MMVQFLIDWENILSTLASATDRNIREQIKHALYRLSEYVEDDGCLVETAWVWNALNQYDASSIPDIASVRSVWQGTYVNCGQKIDSAQRAYTRQFTLSAWQFFIKQSGIIPLRGDSRFVLVDCVDGHEKGDFFIHMPLLLVLRKSQLCKRVPDYWVHGSMLHYRNGGSINGFLRSLEAFAVSSSGLVRLYDPYLGDMFLPAKISGEERARFLAPYDVEPVASRKLRAIEARTKIWRVAFKFFYDVFAGDNNIRQIEIITQKTRNCDVWTEGGGKLQLGEIVDEIVLKKFMERSSDLQVEFHFVNHERSFHDRFVSNGRMCFAIGRGIDILDGGNEGRTVDFNVFYGCGKNACPPGFFVFGDADHSRGDGNALQMYPACCTACSGQDLMVESTASSRMESNAENGYLFKNCIKNTKLSVSVNPHIGEDDF